MIKLGLDRIARLRTTTASGHILHIAGTNGKGSLCHYIDAALSSVNIRTGRFTSPHLLYPHDCVSVGRQTVAKELFDDHYGFYARKSEFEKIGASEFEITTAAAFSIFEAERCEAWIVETGMGGARDATNVLDTKILTVLTKIGLDHQDFLGDTLEDIAKEKCGIMRPKTRCLFDPSNEASVNAVIRREAWRIQAHLQPRWDILPRTHSQVIRRIVPKERFTSEVVRAQLQASPLGRIPYAVENAELGFGAAYIYLLERMGLHERVELGQTMLDAIKATVIPGRFSRYALRNGRHILLDGAHNPQAISAVAPAFHSLRSHSVGPINWLIGLSASKPIASMLKPLLRPHDTVAIVKFSPMASMPWKKATPVENIAAILRMLNEAGMEVQYETFGTDIVGALSWACFQREAPLVGVGSLYLVAELMRAAGLDPEGDVVREEVEG